MNPFSILFGFDVGQALNAALLICFQLTPGLTLGYAWALLALGVAAAQQARRLIELYLKEGHARESSNFSS